MNLELEKAFARDFRKLKSKDLADSLSQAIKIVSEASSLHEITNLRKLTGYKSAYRIRIGDYRTGVIIEKETVPFVAFAHRKEIYKHFPK